MWWHVHRVRVASAQGARTGVSCGSTRSKKRHILGKVSLCKNWTEQCKQSLRTMPQVAYANQLNEVIPQCLYRFKRSFHFQMRSSQCKEITVLYLLHCGKMEHGSNKLIHRWFKTKAQPRQQTQWSGVSLSRASRLRVHEEEPGKIPPPCRMIETEPMRVIVLLGSKVLFISWASLETFFPDLELIQLMWTRLLPHT